MKQVLFIFITVAASFELLAEKNVLFLESNNEILSAEEAFGLNLLKKDGNIIIATWDIIDDCYLYLNSISVKEKADAISFKVLEGNAIDYEDEFFGKTKIIKNLYKISFKFASENTGTKISYQGCSEKGFCYPVQSINVF